MESLRRLGVIDLAMTMATYGHVLRLHQDALNALNVYPVPDGDTGTNMALTLDSVVAELAGLEGLEHLEQFETQPPSPPTRATLPTPPPGALSGSTSMASVCKAIAHGSLMGARGNSGVILSQLLRGLTGVLSEGAEDADGLTLARGLAAASDAARQAVLRPVEGTILTVARAAAEGAQQCALDGASLVEVVEASRLAAADALARTPEQLPVLAHAGVVDAGGSGLPPAPRLRPDRHRRPGAPAGPRNHRSRLLGGRRGLPAGGLGSRGAGLRQRPALRGHVLPRGSRPHHAGFQGGVGGHRGLHRRGGRGGSVELPHPHQRRRCLHRGRSRRRAPP